MFIKRNSLLFVPAQFAHIANLFSKSEIITAEQIAEQTWDSPILRSDKMSLTYVQRQMVNNAITRLQNGRRAVVIDNNQISHLHSDLRAFAHSHDFPYYRVVDDKNNCSRDGIEHVIYENEINIVNDKINLANYNGILVIPDVHGSIAQFEAACEYARHNKLFIIVLGDFIDYGVHTLEVTIALKRLVQNGDAIVIIGNHEYKIFRYFQGYKVSLTHGNNVTIDAFNKLNQDQQNKWRAQFCSFYHMCPDHLVIGNTGFAHGGFHPTMWTNHSPRLEPDVFNIAIFGESIHNNSGDRPIRSYDWVNHIPANHNVFVGHDIIDRNHATIKTNSNGGKVYFLDTGCGKNGKLTVAILNNNCEFQSFKEF